MDSNGLRSFMLRLDGGLLPWPAADGRVASVDGCDEHVVPAAQLASRAPLPPLQEDAADGDAITLQPSVAMDAAGNTLQWEAASSTLWSVSHLVGDPAAPAVAPLALTLPPAAQPVRDIALGSDDIVYLAAGDGLWLHDTRGRFAPQAAVLPPAFTPQRLAALSAGHPLGTLLLLDRGRQRLARLRGTPEFTRGISTRRSQNRRFAPTVTDPDPLALDLLPARFEANERAIALACSAEGMVAVLTVGSGIGRATGGATLRLLRDDGELGAPVTLSGPRVPCSVGWLTPERIALLADARYVDAAGTVLAGRDTGAFVYRLPRAEQARLRTGGATLPALVPLGEFYPLAQRVPGSGFVNVVPGGRLSYLRQDAPLPRPCALARVSLAERERLGWAANFPRPAIDGVRVRPGDVPSTADPTLRSPIGVIDSGDRSTVWHRLYIEAAVPRRCATIIWLAASDIAPPAFSCAATAALLDGAADDDPAHWLGTQRAGWHPHLLGEASALPPALLARLPGSMPSAAWLPQPSEVPAGHSLLGVAPLRDRAGLYTVLVQRADHVVRRLRGRQLWVVVEFFGDGRATVEVAALRAYGGRVSYRDKYLPAVYHERVHGAAADAAGRATGADFLERYLGLIEGVLTPIEDRIAGAYLATDAQGCPADALPWLAAWVGLAFAPGVPEHRARAMLRNAPALAREHGTLAGLQRALDIATDGGITRGRLVVLEHFRLRRTLATILGARLADFDDPLTAGVARSGNSVVGDALVLGDENAKTFLALFRDLAAGPGVDAQRLAADVANARATLFDKLAFRATVLVHETADADELRLIRQVAANAAPAHVEVSVVTARHPFMVAVAALVGADTYLRDSVPPAPVTTDRSGLGRRDTLQGMALLDALNGALADWLPPPAPAPVPPIPPPVADAGADLSVPYETPFTLDGSGSRATPPRRITTYRWRLDPPDDDR